VRGRLICPDHGCRSSPSFKSPEASEETGGCWVQTWFDHVPIEDILRGSISLPVDIGWDEEDEFPLIYVASRAVSAG
jgi:hypothetical protein